MKRLKIVCILMAILLLAGCAATPGTTETPSREEQETGHVVLMGQPAESEPSPESSQEHFEDTPSVEETPYQWDFQKGWPVYVGEYVDTQEDRCWPYGDGEWYNTTGALSAVGEELLYHVMFLNSSCDEEIGKILDSLGVPYEAIATELGNQMHLNLSRLDSVQLARYLLERGLIDDFLNLFTFCDCGDLCGATNTASPQIPEDWWALVGDDFVLENDDAASSEVVELEWDFQKDLPLFVFRPEDEELYWDFPDICFPYGQARWSCLAGSFEVLGEKMLYHVTIREHVVESGYRMFTVDPETPVREFLRSLEIPFESVGEEFYYHLNLSYRDAVTLVGLMHKAGLVESETAGVFDFCYCGNLCGATHTVSPALPNWTDILVHVRNL